eukprot:3465796-Karenia_brevis.AAC.1
MKFEPTRVQQAVCTTWLLMCGPAECSSANPRSGLTSWSLGCGWLRKKERPVASEIQLLTLLMACTMISHARMARPSF